MSRGRPALPIGTTGEVNYTKNSNGQIVASCSIRRMNGSKGRITRSASTKAAAKRAIDRAIEEALLDMQGQGSQIHSGTLIRDLMWIWFEEHKIVKNLSTTTQMRYKDYINRFAIIPFGNLRVRELDTWMLNEFLMKLYSEGHSKPKSAKVVLKPALALAKRYKAILTNPIDDVAKLPSVPRKPVRGLTEEEVVLILQSLPKYRRTESERGPKQMNRLEDGVVAMFGTGLRIGELLGLRRIDVDLVSSPPTISVKGTMIRGESGLEWQDKPKTPSSVRTIPIPGYAARALQRQIDENPTDNPEATVFISKTGGLVADCNFRRSFRDFLKSIGLSDRDIVPHTIRATYATRIESILGIQAASKSLGHRNVNTTLLSYIAQPNLVDEKTAAVIENMYQETSQKVMDQSVLNDDLYEI